MATSSWPPNGPRNDPQLAPETLTETVTNTIPIPAAIAGRFPSEGTSIDGAPILGEPDCLL